MSPKLTTLSIIALLIISTKAYADLSPNPWLEPNSKEDIEQIYKNNRKASTGRTQYTPDATPEIDISHTQKSYTPPKSKGFGSKLKGLFSKDEKELPAPPKNLPPQNIQTETLSSQPVLSITDSDPFGIQGTVNSIKRGVNTTINKTTNLYNHAKKSIQSGVKTLSRQLK